MLVALVATALPALAQAPADPPTAAQPVAPAAPGLAPAPEPELKAAPLAPMPELGTDGMRTAEPEIPRSEPPEFDDLNLGWVLLRTMLVLAMVITLAWLTLSVGLRRLLGIRPVAGTNVVTVLERVPLDQKRALFVVEAAGEVLLIGGADASLNLISKLDRAEVEKMKAARPPSQPIQLSPLLQKLLGRKDSAPPPPASS